MDSARIGVVGRLRVLACPASRRDEGTLRGQRRTAVEALIQTSIAAAQEAERPSGATTPWLSVVLPVRDEIGALPGLSAEIDKVLDGIAAESEVVFVDDASQDGSLEWLTARADNQPRWRVIALGGSSGRALGQASGQATALDAGFQAARGGVIATLDADGQNDPADLPRLLALLGDGVDVVCGVRVDRHDSVHRRVVSRVANAVRNSLTGERVSDVGCSLRVMRAVYARRVRLTRGLHRFLPTLLRLEGACVVETPVSHRPRAAGHSKYGVLDRLPQALRDLWAVRRRVQAARRSARA